MLSGFPEVNFSIIWLTGKKLLSMRQLYLLNKFSMALSTSIRNRLFILISRFVMYFWELATMHNKDCFLRIKYFCHLLENLKIFFFTEHCQGIDMFH